MRLQIYPAVQRLEEAMTPLSNISRSVMPSLVLVLCSCYQAVFAAGPCFDGVNAVQTLTVPPPNLVAEVRKGCSPISGAFSTH